MTEASVYEIRIAGHLDEIWTTWFDGLSITHHDDGTTTLRGVVIDQSQLHGLLVKVRDLGVPLLSLISNDTADHACTPAAERP